MKYKCKIVIGRQTQEGIASMGEFTSPGEVSVQEIRGMMLSLLPGSLPSVTKLREDFQKTQANDVIIMCVEAPGKEGTFNIWVGPAEGMTRKEVSFEDRPFPKESVPGKWSLAPKDLQ